MRLPLIPPAKLSAKQSALYSDMRAGIEKNFRGFVAIGEGGALSERLRSW
jgi:4-carboxymuconolactone decarboxylase